MTSITSLGDPLVYKAADKVTAGCRNRIPSEPSPTAMRVELRLCDVDPSSAGDGVAAPPLAFLSAGIGLCYLTQLDRSAHIAKHSLRSYRVVQDNRYVWTGPACARTSSALPVDTHAFIDSDESVDAMSNLVGVGEQTCFLHAAMCGSHPANISLVND